MRKVFEFFFRKTIELSTTVSPIVCDLEFYVLLLRTQLFFQNALARFPFNGIVIKRKRRQIGAFNNRHDC